jgi:hypothetical protein
MTVEEVWAAIAQRGIELSTEGNRLRYRARKGTLTAELRQALLEYKAALLVALQESEEERREIMAADDVPAAIAPVRRDGPLIVGDMCPRCYEQGYISHLYVRRKGVLGCRKCLRRSAAAT